MDYLLSMFGAWQVGAVAALVNVKFADELDYYFADHTPTVVIDTRHARQGADGGRQGTGHPRHRLHGRRHGGGGFAAGAGRRRLGRAGHCQ